METPSTQNSDTNTQRETKRDRELESERERDRERQTDRERESCLPCSFRGVSHIGFCTQCVIMTYVGGRACVR